jgi:hypothetical protein
LGFSSQFDGHLKARIRNPLPEKPTTTLFPACIELTIIQEADIQSRDIIWPMNREIKPQTGLQINGI